MGELLTILRELPDWIAWRLDALSARLRDLQLSAPVCESWRDFGERRGS